MTIPVEISATKNTRLIYKNLWRRGNISYSSQHPAFPAACTQDDDTTLPWRSRYGTGTGNGLFVVTASNKYIDFDEGGGELTATFAEGEYSGTELAEEIETKLNAAGSGTWTVSYTETTGLFSISWSGGNFTLKWNTGSHASTSAAGLLGFDAAADDSGAGSYTSDFARFNTYEYLDLDNLTVETYDFLSIRKHNLTTSAVITLYGADDAAFTVNVVSDPVSYNPTNISIFLSAARTKKYVRLKVVDPANPAGFIQFGTVVLGQSRDLACVFNQGYGDGPGNESEAEETPSGNRFLTVGRTSRQLFSLTWTHLSLAAKGYIGAAIEECLGGVYSLILCFDYSEPNENTYWVNMIDPPPPTNYSKDLWTWGCEFKEQV